MRVLTLLFCFAISMMANATNYALLVGATEIKLGAYKATYDANAVKGADTDVDKMKEILTLGNFTSIKTLIGARANRSEILKELNRIKSSIKDGDIFVFYFSGHGDTLQDKNKDEMPYLFDQALVTYDDYIIDDELNLIWKAFPLSSKIYHIIDACYSGEMYKLFEKKYLSNKFRFLSLFSWQEGCSGIDGTQTFNMYSASSATKDRTTIPLSNGEGVMTNDIYKLYKKWHKDNKIESHTAAEFFEEVCSTSMNFMFLKIYPAVDMFKDDYVFKF